MSKKKSKKKHKFKHGQSPAAIGVSPVSPSGGSAAVSAAVVKRNAEDVLNLGHVLSDVRRVAILGAGFIILQIALWYVFEHSALGPNVYNLIKL